MIFLKHNQHQQQGFAFIGIVVGVLILVTGIGLISLAKQKRAAREPMAVSTIRKEKSAQPSLPIQQEQKVKLQRQRPVSTLEKTAGKQPAVAQGDRSTAKPFREGTRRSTTRRSAKINPANPTDPQIANFCLQNPGESSCFQHYLIFKNNPSINQLPYFVHLQQIYASGQSTPQTYLNPLNNPDINPMANPDINPLMNPDINPLANPDINPLADPSLNPGCISCQLGRQNLYQQNLYQQPGVNPLPGIPGIPGGYNPGGAGFGRWGR